jgi:hypothetical protein
MAVCRAADRLFPGLQGRWLVVLHGHQRARPFFARTQGSDAVDPPTGDTLFPCEANLGTHEISIFVLYNTYAT